MVGDELRALTVARVEPAVEGAQGHAGQRQHEGQQAPGASCGREGRDRAVSRQAQHAGSQGRVALHPGAGKGQDQAGVPTHLQPLRARPWLRWPSPCSGSSVAEPWRPGAEGTGWSAVDSTKAWVTFPPLGPIHAQPGVWASIFRRSPTGLRPPGTAAGRGLLYGRGQVPTPQLQETAFLCTLV